MSANNEGAGGINQHEVTSLCGEYAVYGKPTDPYRRVVREDDPSWGVSARRVDYAGGDSLELPIQNFIIAPVINNPGLFSVLVLDK